MKWNVFYFPSEALTWSESFLSFPNPPWQGSEEASDDIRNTSGPGLLRVSELRGRGDCLADCAGLWPPSADPVHCHLAEMEWETKVTVHTDLCTLALTVDCVNTSP